MQNNSGMAYIIEPAVAALIGPILTTPEKLENDVFTLKIYVSVHATPKKYENAAIIIYQTWAGKSHYYHDLIVFEKLCFQNASHPH